MKTVTLAVPKVPVVDTVLIRIGIEVFPIYGNEDQGYSMDPADFAFGISPAIRYEKLDEILFALINLNCCPEGKA
jgi:hypothetical protein